MSEKKDRLFVPAYITYALADRSKFDPKNHCKTPDEWAVLEAKQFSEENQK